MALRKLLAAHILGSPFGAATSRWDVAQRPVSAAASVGAGRLPLADSTRGGSRDAGTALAVTERASCWPHRPALGKPLSRCATVREKRCAVSLAFSYALRAYKVKVKVVGRCPTPCKLFEKSLTKNFYACSPKVYLSFQMSRSYSATERSEEKYPALAIFTSILLAQAARSS